MSFRQLGFVGRRSLMFFSWVVQGSSAKLELLSSKCSPTVAMACPVNVFHTSHTQYLWGFRDKQENIDKKERQMIVKQSNIFDEAAEQAKKDKLTFQNAVLLYLQREKLHHRGHVEFIYAAMKKMKEFNVHKDLETYKLLLHVFPKGKMVPRNTWQVDFMHYPKQQNCGLDVLQQMEDNGVIPDDQMGRILVEVFGPEGFPMRKYRRMMYWMPKFKNANPYFVPKELPKDPCELAKIALKRMAVDLENRVEEFQASDLDTSYDKTWIVSAQSPQQRELISQHPADKPLFVEGGFYTWMREEPLLYFTLRADPDVRQAVQSIFVDQSKDDAGDLFNWNILFDGKTEPKYDLMLPPTVHDQENGTFLAMCITGTSSKDSLVSWIKLLQASNPKLVEIPVVFTLRTAESGLQPLDEQQSGIVSS